MSISFHCESCKKRIKAPNKAGGKWGNCPFCNHRCYIPLPKVEDEPELTLKPLDDSEETNMAALMEETKNLTHEILSESNFPDDKSPAAASTHTTSEKEVIKLCILYLRQIVDGQLAAAEKTFLELGKNKKKALRILASMARSERPEPELADVPPTVLEGLIRDVSTKLS